VEVKNTKDLHKILTILRKNKVKSFRSGAFELSFDDSTFMTKGEPSTGTEITAPSYTPEDALFWSSAEGNV